MLGIIFDYEQALQFQGLASPVPAPPSVKTNKKYISCYFYTSLKLHVKTYKSYWDVDIKIFKKKLVSNKRFPLRNAFQPYFFDEIYYILPGPA